MPQIITSISSKAERIKQLKAIKQIKDTHKPGDKVQLLVNNKPVRILC